MLVLIKLWVGDGMGRTGMELGGLINFGSGAEEENEVLVQSLYLPGRGWMMLIRRGEEEEEDEECRVK